MDMFQDKARFDPERDGKVPLRRSPFALLARLVYTLASMLASRHPLDSVRWIRSMLQRRHPLRYAMPWITFDAFRAIEHLAKPGTRVFEFGSGHSTLYWAEKGVEIHSVEDDRGWHDLLAERISGMPNAHLYFEAAQDGYVSKIEHVGGAFDVVVIDGSHRKACLAIAQEFVKPGGLLLVDNTDWHWFRDADTLVPDDWDKQIFGGWAPFIGHRSETTIWKNSGNSRRSDERNSV